MHVFFLQCSTEHLLEFNFSNLANSKMLKGLLISALLNQVHGKVHIPKPIYGKNGLIRQINLRLIPAGA